MGLEAAAIGLIFVVGLVVFATGRVRHDLVAVLMLLTAVTLGLVAPGDAFVGFSDSAVVTVAAVMALSAAISRSGIVRPALAPFRAILRFELGVAAVFSALVMLLSAWMNNVGALALMLPAALAACRSAGVSPSRVLMPMAFASLLGGLMTLIGTPPNILISKFRSDFVGEPFAMFDFTPVGLTLSALGLVIMVALVRLVPQRRPANDDPLFAKIADYLFEVRVLDRARPQPLTVGALRRKPKASGGIAVHAIDRGGIIIAAPAEWRKLIAGDVVQLEGRAPDVQSALEQHGLEIVSGAADDALEAAAFEAIVSDRSPLVMAADSRQLLSRSGAALLAVSRRGRAITQPLGEIRPERGDILLLQAQEGLKAEIVDRFGLLPLAESSIDMGRRKLDWMPIAALAGAVAAAALELFPLGITLIAALALLAIRGRVTQQAYQDVDWSIVLLLAALIPVANAFTELGAGAAVASLLTGFGAGAPPVVVIGAALATTMAVTPFLNNAAAVLIMAPIAAKVGASTGVSVDAMLMAVAVGASSDFLTPIGHQSNTLVMGPGGYRFFDYARLGAPLSFVVLVVGTILIERIWA